MHMRTPKEIVHRMGQNTIDFITVDIGFSAPKTCGPNGSLRKVSASCVCARDRAHKRRYEAVFDTVPRTNSIVSII